MFDNKRINQFYINFKVRDYIEENFNNIPQNILDCSLGVNPFEKNKKNIFKLCQNTNEYPDIHYNKVKNVILDRWKNLNNLLQKENISFGEGSMGIIRNVFQILLEPNDVVLGYSPQFPRAISEIELRRAKYEYYEMKKNENYRFYTDEFINKITSIQKAIYLDNPNNPTGQVININDIERIVEIAAKYNIYVILDEAYGDYINDSNSGINLIGKYHNLIVIRSASKFYGMPDHRIGYIIASREFIELYNEISLPFPFSNISISIFEKNYNNRKKNKLYKKKTSLIKRRIIQSLNNENVLFTDNNTPILTITSNKYNNLFNELLRKGILAADCSQYINLNEKFVRIRINKKYNKLIKILKEVL